MLTLSFLKLELSYQIKDSEAKIVLAAPDKLDVALEAVSTAGLNPDKVFKFDQDVTDHSTTARQEVAVKSWLSIWTSASEAQSWAWQAMTTQKEAMDTTAVLNYSSG